tara:strand:+ start:2441 stop:2650 length:210 start_codon:yes stop_codon:yes gene_type:complete
MQRFAKTIKRDVTTINPQNLIRVLNEASSQLNDSKEKAAAFFLDQIVEWIRAGKSLSPEQKTVSKMLGL